MQPEVRKIKRRIIEKSFKDFGRSMGSSSKDSDTKLRIRKYLIFALETEKAKFKKLEKSCKK
ncbi:TPA: hypothetical protein HA351_00335 [Methanosarcinaceae archaeon]|nr:hypothetical protein [Methanosarcinaceae archaeon]